jgi:hypothetical protein
MVPGWFVSEYWAYSVGTYLYTLYWEKVILDWDPRPSIDLGLWYNLAISLPFLSRLSFNISLSPQVRTSQDCSLFSFPLSTTVPLGHLELRFWGSSGGEKKRKEKKRTVERLLLPNRVESLYLLTQKKEKNHL